MSIWTKETVQAELTALVKGIDQLHRQERYSAQHTRWIARTLAVLEEVFGRNSRYYLTFASFSWSRTGSVIVGGPSDPEGAWNPGAALKREHQIAYREQLESAKGVLMAALDHLERTKDLTTLYEGKDTAPESSLILQIINLAERKLRKVVRDRPSREKEVQDALESLLIGADIPYAREKERIEYSSKTYIPDFTFRKIDLALDLKLCAREGREKEIIQEINDYILAFQTKFGNLFFIVYDVGYIRDVELFVDSFEKHQNVVVRVVKH
jgi:hypothetical protein